MSFALDIWTIMQHVDLPRRSGVLGGQRLTGWMLFASSSRFRLQTFARVDVAEQYLEHSVKAS